MLLSAACGWRPRRATQGPSHPSWPIPDDLVRLGPDPVPGDDPWPAGAFAGRSRLAVLPLVAARRQHPRLRHRPTSPGHDTPFGGGAGMVLRPDVVDAAIAAVAADRPLVFLTPRGQKLTQRDVRRYAAAPGIVLLCGRYEASISV